LKFLAEKSGGVYGYANNAEVLKALYQQQSLALQSEYRVTYVSPATLRDGVNRNLTVSLSGTPASAEGRYNPGGVLPEVSSRSWNMFGIILVGLLVLLIVPILFGFVRQAFSGARGRSGGDRSFGKAPQTAARGRIKLK
jgi:hypothetical protein